MPGLCMPGPGPGPERGPEERRCFHRLVRWYMLEEAHCLYIVKDVSNLVFKFDHQVAEARRDVRDSRVPDEAVEKGFEKGFALMP